MAWHGLPETIIQTLLCLSLRLIPIGNPNYPSCRKQYIFSFPMEFILRPITRYRFSISSLLSFILTRRVDVLISSDGLKHYSICLACILVIGGCQCDMVTHGTTWHDMTWPDTWHHTWHDTWHDAPTRDVTHVTIHDTYHCTHGTTWPDMIWHHTWHLTHGAAHDMTHDTWRLTWHMSPYMAWHMTRPNTWHMTPGMSHDTTHDTDKMPP